MSQRGRFGVIVAAVLAACTPSPGEDAPAPSGAAAVAPEAVTVGDPYRGYAYARQVCSACHAIAPYEPASPSFAAPTFAAVLDRPGMDAAQLKAWLQASHPTMPNYVIAPDSMDDIVAYMMGLRSGGAPP